MKVLVVEDDFTSRNLILGILRHHANCDVAVNGKEAIAAFTASLDGNSPYDLILLDIMMPEMDGQEALKQIRILEEDRGISGLDGVKVIMTSGLEDSANIIKSFRYQCEAYIVKPISKQRLLKEIETLGLINKS
ncbi:MAG: response regulator [Deltaproteobacteria bacterium]|nr:response regulator [Deltaproteobacteria bacterium]